MADVDAAGLRLATPDIIVTEWSAENQAATINAGEDREQGSREGEATEVLRQMEHYFSEENLPHDAHLLGMFEEGDGTVSFNEVCAFKAMRKWARQNKQKTWIKQVLKQSTLIEVVGSSKHPRIRRRLPLQTPLTVTPKVNRNTAARAVPADKPWLTKGMMKLTGFGDGAEDTGLTAEDMEQDRSDYPADESFVQRIETAVTRYCARRKMHQDVRLVFTKYLIFGGFNGGQAQFVGGTDDIADSGLTTTEKAEKNQQYSIWENAAEGLEEGKDGTPATWTVDFEDVVKGFLSSQFMAHFNWKDDKQIKTATNVLRNFNKYLLLHRVCPEYDDQITAAIDVCNMAEKELPELAMVDQNLPGDFNKACSMLFGGQQADQLVHGDWDEGISDASWTQDQAWAVFCTGVIVHGTQGQKIMAQLSQLSKNDITIFGAATDIEVGLEIVAIEMPGAKAEEVYERAHKENPIIKPMGKLRCKEWKVPHADPVDLPLGITDPRHDPNPNRGYLFLLEVSTLKHCYPGCKFTATVKKLGCGILWIDQFENTYPTFYTYLANEVIRDWKEPGPPREGMVRQNAKWQNGAGMELEVMLGDDEELDLA